MQIKSLFETSRLLLIAIVTSATASICCIGPLLLLAMGINGAWMANLMVIEAYQPLLLVLSVSLLLLAGWQILAANPCQSDCVRQTIINRLSATQIIPFLFTSIVVLALATSEYWLLALAT